MGTRLRLAEPLCCQPETITALLIGCTPIQNEKLKKKRHSPLKFTAPWFSLHTFEPPFQPGAYSAMQ